MIGCPPLTSRLQGDSERSTLCEMVAVEPGRGLSCPQGHVPGVLQELLGTEPALVSKAASSIPPTEPWPREPCGATCCPRGAQARLGTGHPSTGPHLPALPPAPVPTAPRAAWRGPAPSNPGTKPSVTPGTGFGQAHHARRLGSKTAGAATRDNRVATVQSVKQQTATCRGTRLCPTDQQPDLTLKCLKLQHEQTHLHIWKQLALEAAIWNFSLVT